MGNEMGNNNVSGLQEEEKARREEPQGKFLEEDVRTDELKGENHMKPKVEDKDVDEEKNLNEKGEGKDFHEVVLPCESPLAVNEPQEEYKTSKANEVHDIEFKPLSGPLEIPADSNDAEKDARNNEKTNLDEILLATAEHCTEKEMSTARETEYTETKNEIVDSKAEIREVDLDSDQHKAVHAEQVAEGIYTTESENGHLVSNDIAEDMYSCVEPENGDQNMATITDTLVVKAMVCEEEFKGPSCGGKVEVFSAEEVDKCSVDEHDGDQSPLDALHPLLEAPESAEASDQQVESLEKSEAPQDDLSSPPETLRAPLEVLEPEVLFTIEAPLESLESPLGDSDPQTLALPLSVEASGSPLEVSISLVEVSDSPLEVLISLVEVSDSPVEDLMSLSATSEPLTEVSSSILKTSELQLEAFTQPSSINTSQEDYEPQGNTINGIIETFKSKTSQSEHISAGSDCNENKKENALASNIERDCLDIESEVQSQENKSIKSEALESALVSIEGPLEDLESPLGGSDPHPLGLPLLVESLDSPLEVSNSLLEVSEPQVEALKSPSKGSEPPLEASNSVHKESQLEAFPQPRLINSSQEVYEAIHIASEMQIGETKLAENQAQSSEENGKNFETLNPSESQSEFEMQSDKPQVANLNQLHEPCLEKQQNIKESLLLAEQRKSIGSEVDRIESRCDHIQTQFCDQELTDPKTDDIIASQSECVTTETDGKTNEQPSVHVSNSTYSSEEKCQLEDFEVNHIEHHISIQDKNLKQEFSEVSDMMSEIKAVALLDNDKPPCFHNSEVFKDKSELVSDSKSESIIIKENFQANLSDAITQSMVPTPEKELEQNIQETSAMTESSILLFDEQNVKDQETVEKLMTESTLDNASGHDVFRKSPSFHFDHSIGSRSEDSDQTPLLCHDKTSGRSLASQDEAMSQMDNLQAGYNAVRDEAVLVAEKTIRMERSDSERPSAPFLSLLQKEESAQIIVTPDKHERVAADKKAKKNPWTVVHKTFALTSPRDNNGKHKSKSSIFSTCICCSTKNT